jgi:hypothetical protein
MAKPGVQLSLSNSETMATGWLHRTIAGLVETTVALAMFAGLAGVHAAELQTNQQFLDQRIDQLAAAGQNTGPGVNFSIDKKPAMGAPLTPGSFPHSILTPGTDTSLKVYGEIDEVIGDGLTGGNSGGLGNGSFSQSPRQSKLGFETRTPTPLGDARTVIEFDR